MPVREKITGKKITSEKRWYREGITFCPLMAKGFVFKIKG
jgi:hypothetical protein